MSCFEHIKMMQVHHQCMHDEKSLSYNTTAFYLDLIPLTHTSKFQWYMSREYIAKNLHNLNDHVKSKTLKVT